MLALGLLGPAGLEAGLSAELVKERFQPATHPKFEELYLLHYDTG